MAQQAANWRVGGVDVTTSREYIAEKGGRLFGPGCAQVPQRLGAQFGNQSKLSYWVETLETGSDTGRGLMRPGG
jgi:hypothetical protein